MGKFLHLIGASKPTNWGDVLLGDLLPVLGYVFLVVGVVATGYAIFLGFMLAKAPDEGKRKQAKDRMFKTIAGLIIVVVLTGLLLPDSPFAGDIFKNVTDKTSYDLMTRYGSKSTNKEGWFDEGETLTLKLYVIESGKTAGQKYKVDEFTMVDETNHGGVESKKAVLFNDDGTWKITVKATGSVKISASYNQSGGEVIKYFKDVQVNFYNYVKMPPKVSGNGDTVSSPTSVDASGEIWGGKSGSLPAVAKGSGGGTDKNPCTYKATDYEKILLARIIQGEAGGQGEECMTAVGEVIMRRVMSSQYGHDTIYNAISAQNPRQYDTFNPDTGQVIQSMGYGDMTAIYATAASSRAAQAALSGTTNYSKGVYFQGSPWTNNTRNEHKIGGETFYDTVDTAKWKLKDYTKASTSTTSFIVEDYQVDELIMPLEGNYLYSHVLFDKNRYTRYIGGVFTHTRGVQL